jgi:F-type H+-transporting ATPase subunit delta
LISIARPYAKAAFEFALAEKKLDVWERSLALLQELTSDKLISAFISNPSTRPEQQSELLLGLLKNLKISAEAGTSLNNFVGILAQNKRLEVLPALTQLFADLRAEHEKTLTVEVDSFSELSKNQLDLLTERLSQRLQRKVSLSLKIDPELLGGAIIRAGNLVMDGSVRTQLRKLGAKLAA